MGIVGVQQRAVLEAKVRVRVGRSVLSARVTGPRAGGASDRVHRVGAGLPRGSRALPRLGNPPNLIILPQFVCVSCTNAPALAPSLRLRV